MSSFTVELNNKRYCRYVFQSRLWIKELKRFGENIPVLLDTGAFNTIIHKDLVSKYGNMFRQTMKTSVGGFCGDARICVLHKLQIGGYVLENVMALAIPFEGELKDHILLGTNVTNNWKFSVSRLENELSVTEQFSVVASERQYPYRYCFDNRGRVLSFQELL